MALEIDTTRRTLALGIPSADLAAPEPPPPKPWLLATGRWNDAGVWRDSAVWRDHP